MLVLVVACLRWRLGDPRGIALHSRTPRHMSPPSLMMEGIIVQRVLVIVLQDAGGHLDRHRLAAVRHRCRHELAGSQHR